MKPEVVHGEKKDISCEFKLEAVRLVTERGVAVAQAAKDLHIHENVLHKWVRELRDELQEAFPGKGKQMGPGHGDSAAAQGGCKAQDGARHPEKSRGLLREGVDVKFGFVAKHRGA